MGYQSLRKLDCLQIIRKSMFSLKNKNLKNNYHMRPTEGFHLGKKVSLSSNI